MEFDPTQPTDTTNHEDTTQSATQATSKLPWTTIVVIVLLLLILGLGFWFLKDNIEPWLFGGEMETAQHTAEESRETGITIEHLNTSAAAIRASLQEMQRDFSDLEASLEL